MVFSEFTEMCITTIQFWNIFITTIKFFMPIYCESFFPPQALGNHKYIFCLSRFYFLDINGLIQYIVGIFCFCFSFFFFFLLSMFLRFVCAVAWISSSVLLLNGTPFQCMNVHMLFSHSQLMDIWVFTFWLWWIMLLWTSVYKFSCGHMFSFHLDRYLGVKLLDCMINTCLSF